MKTCQPCHTLFRLSILVFFWTISLTGLTGQIPPPGYEREMKLREERANRPPMERDSVTLIDTSIVFDPATYQEETIITRTRYSLKDYCRDVLGMSKPEMLLDGKPHTIINPRTFEDLIIRLNLNTNKIDTLPGL